MRIAPALAIVASLAACAGGLRPDTYRYSLVSAQHAGAIEEIRNPLNGTSIRSSTYTINLAVEKVDNGQLCFGYTGFFPERTKATDVIDVLKSIKVFAEAHDNPDAHELDSRPRIPAGETPRPFDAVTLVSGNVETNKKLERQLHVEARLCMAAPAGLTPAARVMTLAQVDAPPDLGFYHPCPEVELGHRMCVWTLRP